MRPADIRCRLCGHHYGETRGCPTCTAAKNGNIDWPAMEDNQRDLLALAEKGIRLLELSLERLEREMTEGSVGATSGHYWEAHADQAMKLNRTLAFILDAARKLQERDEKKVERMTFGEKVELFMEFVNGLPQEHQRNVAERVFALLEPGEPAQLTE